MFLYSDETAISHLATKLPRKVVSPLLAPRAFCQQTRGCAWLVHQSEPCHVCFSTYIFVQLFPLTDMAEAAFYLCAYELAIKTVNSPWCRLLDEVDAQVHTSEIQRPRCRFNAMASLNVQSVHSSIFKSFYAATVFKLCLIAQYF